MPLVTPDLLSATAERHGPRPALVGDGELVTFAELEASSNRFAHSLLRQGIGRGERVSLWMARSPKTIAAQWGVMKAGAACVPIDPAAPPARAAAIARDCEVAGMVTEAARAADFEAAFADGAPMRAVWYADADAGASERIAGCPAIPWHEVDRERAERPTVAADGEDLAQILYTSGSTGKPKGVMIPHRSLLAYVRFTAEAFDLTHEDRVAGCGPLHFGISSFEQFATVSAGAAVYPVSTRIGAFPAAIARRWSEQRLTVWHAVPTLLTMLVTRGDLAACDLSALRLIAFTGEVFPTKHLRQLMRLVPHARFASLYGRTETKVSVWYEVATPPAGDAPLPLGKPWSEAQALVLDESMRPVPDGEAAELWIGGPTVMRGYWKLPVETAESLQMIETSGGRRILACRTGDLARKRPDGNLEFVGRVDHQVKVRGYRVELGEIESTLNRHEAVEQAVALAIADEDRGHRLVAAVAVKPNASANEAALKRHCAAFLPHYMVPETIEFYPRLPLNSNGKVDRAALMAQAGAGLAVLRARRPR